MKAWTYISTLIAMTIIFTRHAEATSEGPKLVPAPIEKVFVSLGFDDNDNAEVVAHGYFSSTCDKIDRAQAKIDMDTKTITLEVLAYHYDDDHCEQTPTPFIQAIKLGVLTPGSYKLEVAHHPDVISSPLIIAPALSKGSDDFIYSPVAQASLHETSLGDYEVRIEGQYPYMYIGCMLIREIRTYVTPDNTLVVLPIAELTDGPACASQKESHKYSLSHPVGFLNTEPYLLHVRTLHGSSLNRLVNLGHSR